MMERVAVSALAATALLVRRLAGAMTPEREDADRGDVPGWVMITLMTAIVVIALVAIFRDQVIQAVRDAFTDVQNSGS